MNPEFFEEILIKSSFFDNDFICSTYISIFFILHIHKIL